MDLLYQFHLFTATHNLNMVINDAAEATVEGISFFVTMGNVLNYFVRGLNIWAVKVKTETKEELSGL